MNTGVYCITHVGLFLLTLPKQNKENNIQSTSRTCHSEKNSLIGTRSGLYITQQLHLYSDTPATTAVGGSAVLVAEASHGVPLAVAAVEAFPLADLGTVLIGRAWPSETYTGQPAYLRLHALLLCIESAYD